ncbi:MAG TPA: glycosyltransferase family 1 protein [Candidatus Dormibacteraeota bacterium]|nr:glycosyltransferase family 1 protein [Candidatus Dormibacteraeota bacterium]
MIRHVLDGRALQDRSSFRGIGTYVRGLLAGFRAAGVTADIGLLLERGAPIPPEVADAGVEVHPHRLRRVNRHLRPIVDPLQIGWALRVDPPELYHAVEYAQPLLPRIPVVLTVHDLIPFVMAEQYPWMRRERWLAMHQFRHADAVIAVSRSTASDLQRIAGVNPGRITVIHEGVAPTHVLSEEQKADVRNRLRVPGRFVLAVGTFDPRKRIGMLTAVVRRLREHHDISLVIAGFQGAFAGAVDSSVRAAGLDAVTRILGHVSGEDLNALYQMSECLLFTSAYEGFGLPPLEAMSAGTAVAAFDNSSLPEVLDGAGLLIRDGDVQAMADAVSAVLGDAQTRARLVELGHKRASQLTWARSAEKTLSVYAHVLARR